jgi:hypothetical protein
MTNYTAEYHRPAYKRGDSIPGLQVRVEVGNPPAELLPVAARAQLRSPLDVVVHEFETQIDGSTVTLLGIPPEVTATFKPGVHKYDLEYTLPDGRVVTWLGGSMRITADVTR